MANISQPTKKDQRFQDSSWNVEQKTGYLLNSKARNFLMYGLTKLEYEKVHSCKSSKEMWDTFPLAYGVHKYELFKMEYNETIDLIFGRFQTIINNLRSLSKTYDNYDHIIKILRSLPRRWRPQVTTLRRSKDLKKLLMEELLVHTKFTKWR
ncbi:hypothetical protein CR513_37300, partial [Mucuna pruriens]